MPFPNPWRAYLEKTLHYPRLTSDKKTRIERSILIFIHMKTYVGAGLDITDEMKIVTAFYACLMVQNRPGDGYPSLQTIILYSDDFVVDELHEHGGIVSKGRSVLDGQSSPDTVVLSWHDAEAEAYHPSEHNVIIHEFAHILDFEDGLSDGVPLLPNAEEKTWEHVLGHAFKTLEHALEHGHLSEKYQLLGEYAATNEAEFFAVASERFFMRPEPLRHHFPALYSLLESFYLTSPEEWMQ
jgi:hypothetical protein